MNKEKKKKKLFIYMFGNRKEEKKREKYISSFPCLVCKSKKNAFFFMPP